MNLRTLRYFVAVAGGLNMSRTAEVLHISQPALSRQMTDLERLWGLSLFSREGRALVLTSQGREMLEHARSLIAEADKLEEEALGLASGRAGVLRIGGPGTVIESVLPELLPGFRRMWPNVDIYLLQDSWHSLQNRVAQGSLDIGFTTEMARETLTFRRLFQVGVVALYATDQWHGPQDSVEVREVAKERLLLTPNDLTSRQLFDHACALAERRPRVFCESANLSALARLAAAGHGVAIVPSSVMVRDEKVRMVSLCHDNIPLSFWLSIAFDKRRPLPDYGQSFVEEAGRAMKKRYPGQKFMANKMLLASKHSSMK